MQRFGMLLDVFLIFFYAARDIARLMMIRFATALARCSAPAAPRAVTDTIALLLLQYFRLHQRYFLSYFLAFNATLMDDSARCGFF